MTATPTHRVLGQLSAFDPDQGVTVRRPEKAAEGYWVGCPGVLYEPSRGRFLMTYRERRPRGAARERGWRCAIAESTDGVAFTDVWAVEKAVFGSASMERFCLLPDGDGYLLYLSYVDPLDDRWRIDVCGAARPHEFDVTKAEPALTAASTGTEGVKDPYALRIGPAVYLYASYAAPGLRDADRARAHATADIFATGLTTHPTGLATSLDGRRFDWRGAVLPVGNSWDRYQARLCSLVPMGGAFVGLYDGSAEVSENYEERAGLALSFDLVTWQRLTLGRPWVTSQHGTGSVRYVDVVPVGEEWWVYYEMTRPDGAHELRMNRIPRP